MCSSAGQEAGEPKPTVKVRTNDKTKSNKDAGGWQKHETLRQPARKPNCRGGLDRLNQALLRQAEAR
jgi:hypothetical protein